MPLPTNNRLIALGAAGALVLAGGGYLLGRNTSMPATEIASNEQSATEEHGPAGFVAMSAERAKAAGIVTEAVEGGGLAAEILAQGVVAPTPAGEAVLAARADGTVVRINRRLGDYVRAGEVVAIMESREAAALSSDTSRANAQLALARSTYEREQRLYNAKVTARQDLEGARAALAEADAEARRARAAARASLVGGDGRSLAVVSVISGRVTKIDAVLGAFVSAGTELFRVSDPSRIQVNVSVLAADAGRIRPGDAALIELIGGETRPAIVRSITPGLDPESKTATVVVQGAVPAPPRRGPALMAVWLRGLRARRIEREAALWRAEMLEPHSPGLRAEFEAWLAADPAHASAYAELERFATLSQRLPAPERRRQRQAVGPRRLAPALGAIALVATAATGLLLVTGREAVTSATVANPGPAIRLYRLSDGSTVTLDVDTKLDVTMKPASREVRIRSGRARFKVTDEPERPFTVSSAGGEVTANGGAFDVALDGDRMTVVSLGGEVRVSALDGRDDAALPVAEGTAVRAESAGVASAPVSREDRLWPVGRLSFDNTPLERIVAMANRLGGPPLRLGSEGIGALKVTAVLDLRDPRALARKLAAALDLKVDESSGEVVLTR